MDPTVLYYALSTIAQCAAALAALIGFLGLWRLEQLRQEEEQVLQMLGEYVGVPNAGGGYRPITEVQIKLDAERRINNPEQHEKENQPQIKVTYERWKAMPREQQQLMRALHRFLTLTLAILVVAIVLLVFADVLSIRVWTGWILKGFIILATLGLGVGPVYMVREAARSFHVLAVLALLLVLVSPVLAGPVRCTTYEEKTMGLFQTLCDDGTRAVSTWSPTLQRWDTTVTPPPGKTCQWRFNPTTRQWGGSCR